MSLYGEWKAGLLTDSEYTSACKREAMEDEDRLRRERTGYYDEDDYKELYEWDLFDDDELMGDISLETDVDKQIVRGLKKVMNEELTKVKKQLEKEVNARLEQISSEFSKQVEKYTGMKTIVFTNVSDLKSFVADLDNQQKKLQKEVEKMVKKEVEKQVNKAKEEAQKQVNKQTENAKKEINKATKDMQKEMKKSLKSLF